MPRLAFQAYHLGMRCSMLKILVWILLIIFITGLLVWLGIFKAIF